MKRSEFVKQVRQGTGDGSVGSAWTMDRLTEVVERAGVTWDPEEAGEEKMLPVWGTETIRLTAAGKWETNFGDGWHEMVVGKTYFPVYAELHDRLMNEREELEKARNLEREHRVYAGLPPNAREVPAPDQPTDDYRERTFWVRDPETGRRALPETAYRELMLRRAGWVDDDPDAALSDEEVAQEKQHVTDGSPCWCGPETVEVENPANGGQVVYHLEEAVKRQIRGWVEEILAENPQHFILADCQRRLDVHGRRLRVVEMRDQQVVTQLNHQGRWNFAKEATIDLHSERIVGLEADGQNLLGAIEQLSAARAEHNNRLIELREMGQRQFDRMELLESSVSRLIDRVSGLEEASAAQAKTMEKRHSEAIDLEENVVKKLINRVLVLERRVSALDDPTRS